MLCGSLLISGLLALYHDGSSPLFIGLSVVTTLFDPILGVTFLLSFLPMFLNARTQVYAVVLVIYKLFLNKQGIDYGELLS